MDERKIAIVGRRDPISDLFLIGMGLRGMIPNSASPMGLRMPTIKPEPAWKSKGRHQGAKEKARRLRQMEKAKKEAR